MRIGVLLVVLFSSSLSFAGNVCGDLFDPYVYWSKNQRAAVREFSFPHEEVVLSPRRKIPTVINGLRRSWKPVPADIKPILIKEKYDMIALGGGMAGSTAALTAVQEGRSVMLIEQRDMLGGLAYGNTRGGNHYDGGTAYYSSLIPQQEPLYKWLKLQDWEKESAIKHPSDSLYIPGGVTQRDGEKKTLSLEFWEDPTLKVGWLLTRWAHTELDKQKRIPNQPIEDAESPFDNMTYEQFLRSQYYMLQEYVARHPRDKEARQLWNHIQEDITSGKETIDGLVDDVINHYAVNYMHSALGGMPNLVNAAAGINFVYSEMTTRYSYPFGTNEVIRRTEEVLRKRPEQATISLGSTIEGIEETNDGVVVTFTRDGLRYQVEGKKAIFSMPLNIAQKTIKNFAQTAPDHNRIIQQYIDSKQLTDYMVANLIILGHPKAAVRKTYDMWISQNIRSTVEFSLRLLTDFISGEWMWYKGYKKQIPKSDKYSVGSDYHPLGETRPRDRQELLELLDGDIDYLKEIYDPMILADGEKPLDIRFAEVNFWPNSILSPRVGHFRNTKILRQRVGRNIQLAVAGWMGTPSHEEAQYRGWLAAKEFAEELRHEKNNEESRVRRK